jgi:mRNA interferase MazF
MGAKPIMSFPQRGEVYLVNFDPAKGYEIQKTRPALIVQNNVNNEFSHIVIVAAISSNLPSKKYLTNVLVKAPEGGLDTDSVVVLNQVRSVDKIRLEKKLGTVSPETMEKVNKAIQYSFGLIDF